MARSDVDVALGAAVPDGAPAPVLPQQRHRDPAERDERLLAVVRRGLVPDDPIARLIARFSRESAS